MYGNLCEPWPHIWCGNIEVLEPAITGYAVMAASEILWEATGRQFGNCPVNIRPCRKDCAAEWPQDVMWSNGILGQSMWGWPYPALVSGVWLNLACGVCAGECSCTTTSDVVLAEPIESITSITVDGVPLVSGADYVMYDAQRLVRVGAEWPRCQDWTKTEGEGTWIIRASFGAEVPTLGQMAVGALAEEIAKACQGLPCNLTPSVVRVVRQGVTMERIAPKEVLNNNLTGLWLPDRFIMTFNPQGLQDRARAFNPDDFDAPRQQT